MRYTNRCLPLCLPLSTCPFINALCAFDLLINLTAATYERQGSVTGRWFVLMLMLTPLLQIFQQKGALCCYLILFSVTTFTPRPTQVCVKISYSRESYVGYSFSDSPANMAI